MAELSVGDIAPAFSLARGGTGTIDLAGLKGRIVVLYFYPKDDTPGCTAEAIDFSQLKTAFEAAGATVVGVSPDSPKRHANFAAKHGLAIDLASDETHDALNAYGVWGEKSMYGKTFMGVERSTFVIGPDGRIKRIWRKVKVPGHAAEVLAAVRGLAG
jgi:peroxiredoxin Q/BCP